MNDSKKNFKKVPGPNLHVQKSTRSQFTRAKKYPVPNWKIAGITLIALVVTVIVLLILAAISISMLTGNNGIIGRAGEAK